jgi:hypothetical protein
MDERPRVRRKPFFFEKKNQKTFGPYGFPVRNTLQEAKVFCFFFSKKKAFLASKSALQNLRYRALSQIKEQVPFIASDVDFGICNRHACGPIVDDAPGINVLFDWAAKARPRARYDIRIGRQFAGYSAAALDKRCRDISPGLRKRT